MTDPGRHATANNENSAATRLETAGAEASPHHAAGRLDSWKDIASFFNRSVRTVQRWEESEAMPVPRHSHRVGDSVFAYGEELNQWHRNRSLCRSHRAGATVKFAAVVANLQAEETVLRTLLEVVLKRLGVEPADSTTASKHGKTFQLGSRPDQRSVMDDARSSDRSSDGNGLHAPPLLSDMQ